MAYEKADFYAAYGIYARDPVTGIRYANATIPEFPGETITLRLHYHPAVKKTDRAIMAGRLVDYFINQGSPLVATDKLVVIGGAFGWLGEALEDQIIGLEVVTIDLSQYVQDSKDQSPDDELIESIIAVGYTITDGYVGQYLFERFTDPAPRSRDGSKILQEDLTTTKSRNSVRKALRQADPTRIITEEVWQILSQADKDQYTAAAANWGVPLTHIIDGVIL